MYLRIIFIALDKDVVVKQHPAYQAISTAFKFITAAV